MSSVSVQMSQPNKIWFVDLWSLVMSSVHVYVGSRCEAAAT